MNYLTKENICGVVILYNPTIENILNFPSYINQIDLLIVVDNSEKINQELITIIKSQGKVNYINNGTNLGIAKALNVGAEIAIDLGYKYLLTMDQDASLVHNYVDHLLVKINQIDNFGLISAFHSNKLKNETSPDSQLHKTINVMMCGNILNLDAFKIISGFKEQLFIDYVDYEYCLNLISNGFSVYQDNSIQIQHNLGTRKLFNLMGIKVTPSNHNPLRLYYKTRNRFFVYKSYFIKFPAFILRDFLYIPKELIYIILFEQEKKRKFIMIAKGFFHFIINKYGRINKFC